MITNYPLARDRGCPTYGIVLGFTVSVQPNLQQASEVVDLMECDSIGIVIVVRAIVSGADDVENVVAVELPIDILETG